MSDYTVCELIFDLAAYSDSYYKQLAIVFPEAMTKAVIKRKAEFLAGRYAARQCIEKLQIESKKHSHLFFGDVFDLQAGVHKSPLWPKGIVGSISHTNSRACALVANTENYKGVGIDIENWLPNSACEQIASLILAKNDHTFLKKINSISHSRFLTLIFSAKESLFKALYPSVGYYFDFKDAEVIQMDYKQQYLRLKLLKSLGTKPWLQKYAEHTVQFQFRNEDVQTCILVKHAD
jgi:enterobactin synthetase component D